MGDCLPRSRQNLWSNCDGHPGSLHTIIILAMDRHRLPALHPVHPAFRAPPGALRTPFVFQITSRGDDGAHHLGCLALHGLGEVGVAVQRYRHPRMPEHLGGDLGVHPATQEQDSRSVAEIVEPHSRKPARRSMRPKWRRIRRTPSGGTTGILGRNSQLAPADPRGWGPHPLRDIGPEFGVSAIGDWGTRSSSRISGIDRGSPWQNAFEETIHGNGRDEPFAREIFNSILASWGLYADWCRDYDRHRPHRSLGRPTPKSGGWGPF